MKEFRFVFANGNTTVVQSVDYARALISIYNPQTRIVSFSEKLCRYRYDIKISNVYIPKEVGEFSYTKHHEVYSTKLLRTKELDDIVKGLDLGIESERLYEDDYEIVDYEHTITYIGEQR